jgi:glycine betaine/proline transport system ATP-binding protein
MSTASVMEPARSVVTVTAGPRAALRTMRDLQSQATFVLGRDRTFAGIVRDRDVLRQVKRGETDLRSILLDDATTVTPDVVISELVELSVASDLPIAVLDDKGRLIGVIPRVTLLAALGNVTSATGEIPITDSIATISVSEMTDTLLDPTLEGAGR